MCNWWGGEHFIELGVILAAPPPRNRVAPFTLTLLTAIGIVFLLFFGEDFPTTWYRMLAKANVRVSHHCLFEQE